MSRLILIALLFIIQISYSQDYGSEPEWTGSIVYIDSACNQIQLESQKCSYEQKKNLSSHAVGVGKVKGKNCVNGGSSNVVIEKSDTLIFIARYSSNDINPKSLFNIFKLEQSKNNRCITVASSGTFEGSKVMDIDNVEFTAEKYGQSSYLIKIMNLEAGEYSLTFENRRDQFNLFSVENRTYSDTISQREISINDTVYFKVGGEYVLGNVKSIEKHYVKASYTNRYGLVKTKIVNFEYLLFTDPRK